MYTFYVHVHVSCIVFALLSACECNRFLNDLGQITNYSKLENIGFVCQLKVINYRLIRLSEDNDYMILLHDT